MRRASAGLAVIVLGLGTAGCGEFALIDLSGDTTFPALRLTDAEFVEYDGEVLTVRADLFNEDSPIANPLRLEDLCAEVESHGRPCYFNTDGLGSNTRLEFNPRVRAVRYEAESARVISGSSFNHLQGDEWNSGMGLPPGSDVQLLLRFRIPDLMPGDTVKFYGVASSHAPHVNRPPVELVVP